MVGVIVSAIFPGTIRYGTLAVTGIYPVNSHADVVNTVVETVGLVTAQPVGNVEQYIANETEVVEMLRYILASIQLTGPVAITESTVVTGSGSTLDLLIVETCTQTQQR